MSNQEEIDVIIERRNRDMGVGVHAEAVVLDDEWREETLVEHIGRVARENPATAALVGAGLVWMALGGGRNIARGASAAGAVVGDAARVATSAASQTAKAVGDAVATSAESAQEAAARVGKTVVHTARAAVGTADEAAAQAADVAGRKASRAEDYAEGAVRRTGFAASQAGRGIAGNLRGGAVAVRHSGKRARRAASDLAQNQPVLLSALCLATGAGLAALLPRTRTEDELLGEYKEEALHRATRRVTDLAVGSVRKARARTSEAVHEAARQAAEEAAEGVLRQAGGIGDAVLGAFDKVTGDGGAETDARSDKGGTPRRDQSKGAG